MSIPSVKPVPDGMHSITPHLVCAGAADAIAFCKQAFDAVELSRLPGPSGKLMHAMIRIGDSPLIGRRWSLATHVRAVSPEEMQQAMCRMDEMRDACPENQSVGAK